MKFLNHESLELYDIQKFSLQLEKKIWDSVQPWESENQLEFDWGL